ncbi:MAG: efflux RND transporter periplasmic adaptor subunit [Planctomycetota bacterium]
MQRQVLVSLILIVVLLGLGAGVAAALIHGKRTPPQITNDRPALAVHGVKVTPSTVTEPIVGYGTAIADQQAWISTQVSGVITRVADTFEAGEPVQDQQKLIWIDDHDYHAALDRSESQLVMDEATLRQLDTEEQNLNSLIKITEEEFEVADRELNRVRILLEQGNSNQREIDQARLSFEQARRALQLVLNEQALLPDRRARLKATCALRRADVSIARLNVERCTITAPFAGQLDEVLAEQGEHIAPGAQLFSIVDPGHIDVPIELPVALRGRLRVGAPCQLTLESRQDAVWRGQVVRIAPSADALTRTFALYVEVDNSLQAEPLVPGMFVRARIDGPLLQDVIILPRGCIHNSRVWVARDGHAYATPVTTVRHLLDRSVVDGLNAGEVVITSNLDVLYDGVPVNVLLDQPAIDLQARTTGTTP